MTAQQLKTPQRQGNDTPQRELPEQTERLEAIAQRVAADARIAPAAYRRESRVPAGGE